LVIKTLDLYPEPDSLEMLDLDPYRDPDSMNPDPTCLQYNKCPESDDGTDESGYKALGGLDSIF
jgi:hypothetical protein